MYERSQTNNEIVRWGTAFAVVLLVIFFAPTVYAQGGPPNVGAPPGPGSNAGPGAGTTAPGGALARDGVFGCSASKYQNIGSLSAVGGVYVPVNDAAVTLNTGYLVYKECVLDGVVSAIKNSAVATLQEQMLNSVQTSRGGKAQYLLNFREDLRPRKDAIVLVDLGANAIGPMCDGFKRPVQTAIVRSYLQAQNDPSSIYACPFRNRTSQEAFLRGAEFTYEEWFDVIMPEGNVYGAAGITGERIRSDIAEDDANVRQMLDWGRGVFSVYDQSSDPLRQRTLTPGFMIADSIREMIGAGLAILVNANEIDQVNGALQAGLSTAVVTDTLRGLAGLSRPQNGQPSYLSRMSAEASAGVRANAVNAALSILSAARQIETLYKNAKEAIANALTSAIGKLKAAEKACWDLIIPKVQEKATAQGVSLRIATSTQFSQKVIDEKITPVATITIRDLRIAESTLNLINQLIAAVTNNSSTQAQRAALERLDSLVSTGQLHSASEAQAAQKQKDEVIAAINTLIEETIKEWGDDPDADKGWCNINNPAVIDRWLNAWKI